MNKNRFEKPFCIKVKSTPKPVDNPVESVKNPMILIKSRPVLLKKTELSTICRF